MLFTWQYLIQNMILTGFKLKCSCTCKHAECHLAFFSPARHSGLLLSLPHVSHKLVIHHPCRSPIRITCRLSSGPINVLAHWFSRTCCGITFNHNTGSVYICRHRKNIYLFDLGKLTSVKHTGRGKLTTFWVILFFFS